MKLYNVYLNYARTHIYAGTLSRASNRTEKMNADGIQLIREKIAEQQAEREQMKERLDELDKEIEDIYDERAERMRAIMEVRE